jgi:hypothetical protein
VGGGVMLKLMLDGIAVEGLAGMLGTKQAKEKAKAGPPPAAKDDKRKTIANSDCKGERGSRSLAG